MRKAIASMRNVAFVAVAAIVVGAMGWVAFATPPSGQALTSSVVPVSRTVTLTGGNFFFGGIITIQSQILPTTIPSNGTVQLQFLVTSGVSGNFEFAVATKGTPITPPPDEGSEQLNGYTLPPYVGVEFSGGNSVGSAINATSVTVSLSISTTEAPTGTIPLELVVFQQQTPLVVAETAFPFVLTVG
jgi:hypothetical protein